jgi:hypothetical protein
MASSMGTVRMRPNQVGADTEPLKLKSPLSILHLEDDPNDAAIIQSALETAEIICSITRVQTPDDFLATLELSRLAPAVRRAMREVEGIEQLRLEAQVTESQKLELISQLSSRVAHDAKKAIRSVP